MRSDKPSATARGAAALRSRLDRPATAEADLYIDKALTKQLARGLTMPRGMLYYLVSARTRFIDQQILEALDSGVDQVVIVGAGYDPRAFRFRKSGVRYYELDFPTTQADKRRRVTALGADVADITYASINLAEESVADVLVRAGHQGEKPTLFICEGVIVYLRPQTVSKLFADLRLQAASGSVFAFDYPIQPRALAGEAIPGSVSLARVERRVRLFDRIIKVTGEPVETRSTPEDARRLFISTGWDPATIVDPATIEPGAGGAHIWMVAARPYVVGEPESETEAARARA